jgi:hypothetical protein
MKPKRINKVYINIKRLHYDYRKNHKIKLSNQDIADFIFSDIDNSLTRLKKYQRKIKERSKYELTITECYNLCLAFRITIEELIKKYILPL